MWGNRDPDAAFRALAKPVLVLLTAGAGAVVWFLLVWQPTAHLARSSAHGIALLLILCAAFFVGAPLVRKAAGSRWPSGAGVVLGASQGGVFGVVVTERDFASLGTWAPDLRFGWYVLSVALFATLGAVVGALAVGSCHRAADALERREIDILPSTLRDGALWAGGAAAIAHERELPLAAGALAVAAVGAFVAMLFARRRRDRIVEAVVAGEMDGWRWEERGGVLLVDTGGVESYRRGPVWTIVARASRRRSIHDLR